MYLVIGAFVVMLGVAGVLTCCTLAILGLLRIAMEEDDPFVGLHAPRISMPPQFKPDPRQRHASLPPALPRDYSPRRRWLGGQWYWLFQGAGLLFATLVLCVGNLSEPKSEPLPDMVLSNGALVLLLVLHAHLLRVVILRLRLTCQRWLPFLVRLAAWTPAFAASTMGCVILWVALMAPELAAKPENELTPAGYASGLLFLSSFYVLWSALYLGVINYRAYRASQMDSLRLSAQVKEAELRTLKAQINPHFLFNSLNTVRALIPGELERPRKAVTLLSELLRAALSIDDAELIPLSAELETVRCYLALEALRFEERLRVVYDIAPTAAQCPVPPFVVQTLVENAVKYGVAPLPGGGCVRLRTAVEAGRLIVEVVNDAHGPRSMPGTGLGLRNARARLRHLYGEDFALTLDLRADGSACARLDLPAAGLFTHTSPVQEVGGEALFQVSHESPDHR